MASERNEQRMKLGKVSETILKRTILKQIHIKRNEVLCGAGVGLDCAMLKMAQDEILALSTEPIVGSIQEIGTTGVIRALNNLAASGAEPVGILLTILLPEHYSEAKLKKIMGQAEAVCAKYQVQILGGHTTVSNCVTAPVLNVTAVGKQKEGKTATSANVKPGMDLVITKWIGLEGTVLLAQEKEEELQSRYTVPFVEKVKKLDVYLSILSEAAVAVTSGVGAMHDASEGGIFGALWSMAEASGVGLEIDVKKIPIRQETVEVCEFFGVNPYELQAGGSLILATEDGNGLVADLEKAGIPATIVGKATAGNDRVLLNGEETRFLEPPKTDEIHQFF